MVAGKPQKTWLRSQPGGRTAPRRADELWIGAVQRQNVSDEVANQVITSIVSGELRFGDKLPSERDLATHFGVGRPTIREALRTLSVVGLIDIRHGEGAFVVDNDADFVAKAFSWVVLLDPATTREVVEARIAIEGTLARFAAERRTAEDLAKLRNCVEQMERATAQHRDFADADLAFHMTIAGAARNKALSRVLTGIRSLLQSWIETALASDLVAEEVLTQHRAIHEAVLGRDSAAAEAEMRHHLDAMAAYICLLPGYDRDPGDRPDTTSTEPSYRP